MRIAIRLAVILRACVPVLALVLGAPASAWTQPFARSRLELSRTHGAEACPEESFLRDATAARLDGSDPFTAGADKRITLVLKRAGHGYVADAALYEGDERLGTRVVSDGDCTALVEVMAMIFASWLTPGVPPEPPPGPEVPPPPPPPPFPAPTARPEPAPAPSPSPSPRPRLVIEAGALAAFGSAPGVVSFGLAGAVGARWERFSLSAGVEGHLPASHDGSSSVSLMVGTVAPCAHLGWFVACGLAEAGALLSAAPLTVHLSARLHPAFAYGAAGLRAGGDVPLVPDRLALRVAADLLAPFARATTTNDREANTWTMPPVRGAVGLRLVGALDP